ncbi:MAG: Gfo/Idh/MocA family oxidoreductase [archaeon]|jgi:predicted dehydrogenase
MINFGLVGCGQIAEKYVTILSKIKNAQITQVYDIDNTRANLIGNKLNAVVAKSVPEMLNFVDALIIATPPATHTKIALLTAKKGKHLYIEKPITTNLKDTKRIINACKRNKCRLQVNFQYRQSRIFKALKNNDLTKVFGKIVFVNFKMNWLRDESYYTGWRGSKKQAGGGVIINQAIHFIDFTIQWLGKPKRVYCVTKINKFTKTNVEDTALVVFEYANGTIVYFRLSTCTYPDLHDELEISGTNGELLVSNINLGGKVLMKQFKEDTHIFDFAPYETNIENNLRAFQSFVTTINNNTNDFKAIISTMEVIESLYKSSKKKTWVKV